MTTFTKATFNTAIYAASRPVYPRQLYEYIFRYHGNSDAARWDTAVDLGCGTGQATIELTPFKRIIGVDPSAKMIQDARKHVQDSRLQLEGNERFEFVQSGAEELNFLENESVDLIIAAQAAHWFNYDKIWPEAARVLRPGGSVAFWIYSEFRLGKYPSLTPLITEYAQGTDPVTSLGPYWQRPGRTILENHLVDVPEAGKVVPGKFTDWKRVYFTGTHYASLPSPLPTILHKHMSWSALHMYLHTFSSLHTFHEHFPADLERSDGDIATRFWHSLREGVRGEGGKSGEEDEVEVEWPVAMILVRKV